MTSRLETWFVNGPRLSDGAWGTELQARGLAVGECPDEWNLSHADRVLEVARGYVEAGSDIILTNTFRANAFVIGSDRVEAVNRAGVEISRQAAGEHIRVAASLGPSGKMLVNAEVSPPELRAAFGAQARALAAGGADALILETMSDIEEARIAVSAMVEAGLPVIVSFAFDSGKNKDRTMMGATPEQAAEAMAAAGADAVGANCGAGPEPFAGICKRLKAAGGLPVWVKPNAGMPTLQDGRITYSLAPAAFGAHWKPLVEAGASFIGGCCGTSPAFIRALAAARA